MNHKENVIRKYFDSWLTQNNNCWNEIFSEDIMYSECYGPYYQGLPQMKVWFERYKSHGKVLRWDIKHCFFDGEYCIVEWRFQCLYDGEESAFDGVSILCFHEDGKIIECKEFQSLLPHVLADFSS